MIDKTWISVMLLHSDHTILPGSVYKFYPEVVRYTSAGVMQNSIAAVLCDFFKHNIYHVSSSIMVRMISERHIEKQRDAYMCFIDYTKAFDRVQHDELLKRLMNLDLYGKEIHLIWNLYWDQSACAGKENKMSEYTKVKRGVCQGCVLSPDLFNLYSKMIL